MFRTSTVTADRVMQPCIVVWEDAEKNEITEQSELDTVLQVSKMCLRRTVGYYIGRKETRMHFCIDDDGGYDTTRQIGGMHQIPIGMIRELIWLVPESRRRKKKPARR